MNRTGTEHSSLIDELALMFTGSKALPSQITRTLSTSIAEEDEGSELSPAESGTEQIIDQSSLVENVVLDSQLSSPDHPDFVPTARAQSLTAWVHPNLLLPLSGCPPHPLFTTEQLGVDRRLLVNRKRQLKMYRVWMQGKFRRIVE